MTMTIEKRNKKEKKKKKLLASYGRMIVLKQYDVLELLSKINEDNTLREDTDFILCTLKYSLFT